MGLIHIRYKLFILAGVVILLTGLPFLVATLSARPDFVFGGFLINTADGNSYLAKMYQGWSGSWTFQLPFSANPGGGTYIFLFYLFLGHLAHWLRLPLLVVFHAARLVCGGVLVFALDHFYQAALGDGRLAWRATLLASLGSGLGYLGLLAGVFTSDLWVAEAYPFLSTYSNPHFPLSLAIMLWLISARRSHFTTRPPALPPARPPATLVAMQVARYVIGPVLAGLALATLLPFGAILVLLILGCEAGWVWLKTRRLEWQFPALVFLGAAPMLLYQYGVMTWQPALAAWNAQNLTPSPPVWDVLLALSPALLLAIPGVIANFRKNDANHQLIAIWALVGLVLLVVPFSLQRRFMLGLFIPLAGLAVVGIDALRPRFSGRWNWLFPVVMVLSLPSNLVVLAAGVFGVVSHAPDIFLTVDEDRAIRWLADQPPGNGLVLAGPDPDLGLFLPGRTGKRVVYGHPFETLDASNNKETVIDFFAGKLSDPQNFLKTQGVDFVLCAPGKQVVDPAGLAPLKVVYVSGTVSVYRVGAPP